MLRTLSFTGSSTILQSIDPADENKIGRGESSDDETNLSNLSASKWSTKTGYVTFESTKRGDANTKKGVKVAKGSNYLTSASKKAFNHLRHVFTQAPIFQHFDPEQHIWIETNISDYAINKVPSQLTLDDLSWWHFVAYYLYKMISAKTWYKTHDGKLLVIVEVFKTWRHYLEGCNHKVLVFTNYNNFCRFMDMKSLTFCQVWWAKSFFAIIFG